MSFGTWQRRRGEGIVLAVVVAMVVTAAVTVAGLAAPAAAQLTGNAVAVAVAAPAGGNCHNCTIEYTHTASCRLKRKVECKDHNNQALLRCVEIPGYQTKVCRSTHESSMNGVTVTLKLGTAKMQSCTNRKCSGGVVTCDITYLEPTPKPPAADTPVTSDLSLGEDGEAILAEVVWDGVAITYTLTNTSTTPVSVTWFGTTFGDQIVAPGDSVSESVISEGQPVASVSDVIITDLDEGESTILEAVTFFAAAETPTDPDEI